MSYRSQTLLKLPDTAPLLHLIKHELADHDLPFTQSDDGRIVSPSEYGSVSYAPVADGLVVEITSQSTDHLYILRESIEAHLTPVHPMLTAPIVWEGHSHSGTHPPHFRKIKVVSETRVSPNFIRLRFSGDDLGRYAQGGLHFRLLIPANADAPVWPTVSETGSTIWPTGNDALHMPAYTFRTINAAEGWFDVDVFVHGKGATCNWAHGSVGKIAGMLGPGGGDMPQAQQILLAGDETALPAIARMLEIGGSDIEAIVAVDDPGDLDLCEGHPVQHVPRDALLGAIEGRLASRPFVWFGGAQSDARELKKKLLARNYDRSQMQVQAYWK